MAELQSLHCAGLLLLSMALAGTAQTLWFKSAFSQKFAKPLDADATFRGRRVFGDNKTWRGFVVMLPAAGLFCALVSRIFLALELSVWELGALGYFGIGLVAGLGLMLGELPNSFIKRQLDIAPGTPPRNSLARVVSFLADRFDSILGVLIFVSLVVHVSLGVWLWAFVLGPPLHWMFSVALYALGVKKRPA